MNAWKIRRRRQKERKPVILVSLRHIISFTFNTWRAIPLQRPIRMSDTCKSSIETLRNNPNDNIEMQIHRKNAVVSYFNLFIFLLPFQIRERSPAVRFFFVFVAFQKKHYNFHRTLIPFLFTFYRPSPGAVPCIPSFNVHSIESRVYGSSCVFN